MSKVNEGSKIELQTKTLQALLREAKKASLNDPDPNAPKKNRFYVPQVKKDKGVLLDEGTGFCDFGRSQLVLPIHSAVCRLSKSIANLASPHGWQSGTLGELNSRVAARRVVLVITRIAFLQLLQLFCSFLLGTWIEEQSKDTNMQKGTKQTEEMKKEETGDRQRHLANRRVAI
uniref:Uncharacterized protein n=1 Tax=Solanum tuberosum TaxID=4113 RepID=M1DFT3_SOLTU